ncbi:MAG: rod shape-determining protein MreC [Deltaproteobacteria bacterium]|nr:rod shape-determining protein MreC [Deltaproteobacteria bacterium]
MLKPRLKSVSRFLVPLFIALFFISLLSVKTRRAPWYEQWTWNVMSPVVSFFSWTHQETGSFWRRYIYFIGIVRENEDLQKEVDILRQRVATEVETEAENKRLADLLDLKTKSWPGSIAARVVGYDPRSEFKSLRINKGTKEGIKPDMPVVAPEGLVGKIGPVFSHDALVLLIVDPASTVDVLLQRSRARALLVGMEKETELRPGYFLTRLEYLKRTSDIQMGDTVVTSGLDQLFPKGILVGTVEAVQNGRFGIFIDAEVVPIVDFSRMEEVLVLKQ